MPEFTIPPGFALVPLEPFQEILDALRIGAPAHDQPHPVYLFKGKVGDAIRALKGKP